MAFRGLIFFLLFLAGLASTPVFSGDVTLEEDAGPLVKALSRPVEVFHWVSRERAGLSVRGRVDPHGAKVLSYTRKQIDAFWQTGVPQSGTLGNGLYVSTDPVATREYGGDDW